ncbi:MAG: DUF1836 domain-containing protein [Carnobacterium maltaromaticum]
MNTMEKELELWGQGLEKFQLPRWNLLPDIDLYMDQVLTMIEKYLSPLMIHEDQKIITAAMINNYVKLGLIPAPVKKRYTRKHIAFLIAISILKQVFTIQEIKDGILFQASVVGINEAFNLFCDEQEKSLYVVAAQVTGTKSISILEEQIPIDFLAVKLATLSFATKLITEKTIALGKEKISAKKEAEE